MKIAVASTGRSIKSEVANHTGRAVWFVIYDTSAESYEAMENAGGLQCLHWAGTSTASKLIESDVAAVVTRRIGPNAFNALTKAGLGVYLVDRVQVNQALRRFREGALGKLNEPNCRGHEHNSKSTQKRTLEVLQ